MTLTKSRTAKFFAGFVGLAIAFSFAVTPVTAGAATIEELQAMIISLQAQLAALSGGGAGASYTFNVNLTVGSRGTDVMNLQKVLNMSADTQVALVGPGSPGNETTYFGALTKQAVMKFQSKYGISPVAGYVGPITRAKLNTMGGPVVVVPPPVVPGLPTGGALSVSAGSQPANSLAPQSASRVPFTKVMLSAGSSDITVNSITVERVGLASDSVFSGVVLLSDNGMQIGIAKTLNSNHQASVGEPWVIKAGTSQTVTVAGNMASSLTAYSGQVVGLNVVAVNTTATVSGSFPISGAQHTVNSTLSLGTATLALSSYDPNQAQTKAIGTTGYKFAGVRVTAGSVEQVRLWSVRWNQSGSASANDLSNVMVYVDGTSYPTVVSSDGKYYSAVFPGGILLDKGLSKDVYIQGDIMGTGSSGRTVQFDLYKNTDLYMSGVTYGYGIIGTASANCNATASTATTGSEFINSATNCTGTVGTPFFSGSTITVSSGSVTSITKATSVPAQNVALNVPNQVFGGFTTDIKGEPISVQSLVFSIATTGTWASSGVLTSVTIVDENGAVVAGPVDQPSNAAATLTFSDTVTFPLGAHTYTIKGRIPSGAPNGGTIILSSTPSSQWTSVTGQTTGNTISLSANGAFSMNTMTVKSAALTITVASTPSAQSIVSGGRVTFVNYQFDASNSGEDVRFGVFPLANDRGNNNYAGAPTKMTSCQLYDGTTALNTGTNVLNPTDNTGATATTSSPQLYSITLDSQFTVPKGTVKTLSLACNVSSSADSSSVFDWGLTSVAMTVTGVTSGADVSETITAATGPLMTVATGSFTGAIDSSTSSYTTVAAGTAGVNIGTFKFRATNENINLTKIGLVLSTSTPSDLGTVSLWQGATQIGTATFTGTNTVATSTLTSALLLTKNTDVLITIKADLGLIGTDLPATPGRLVQIDVVNAEGSGASSGSTLTAQVTAGVNGVRMFKSFPVVAQDTSLPSGGVADGRLMRFKITADSHGPVGLSNLNFTIATSGTTALVNTVTGSLMVQVFSDSSYTQAVGGSFGTATGQFGTTTAAILVSNPTLDFSALTNPLQIPAGTTYYFQLSGTVAGVTTGSSVTTTLNGDAAYVAALNLNIGTAGPTVPMMSTTTAGIIMDTNNDFIWSDNATSTSVFSSNDWANGYGIQGLSSSGFSTTRGQ